MLIDMERRSLVVRYSTQHYKIKSHTFFSIHLRKVCARTERKTLYLN